MIKTILLFILISANNLSYAAFPRSVFDNLDYGLYWAGAQNQFEKAGENTQNGSRFYNPSKPTLIYVHGWTKDSSSQLLREDFNNTRNGRPNIDFANLWRDHGYNVGIIYWNQFADESEVKDAEAKIWSATGRQGMRWRNSQGVYQSTNSRANVSDILLSNYLTAMAEYTGSDLRIAGHSLGNQLAIKLTHMLKETSESGMISSNLVPQRVSLLDAFYTQYAKDYLNGRWVGGIATDLVRELKNDGIAIDSYRSSATGSTGFVGDSVSALQNEVAFVELGTKFFYWWSFTQKHIAATWLYLGSINHPMPPISNSDYPGISATTPNHIIREWMYSNRRAIQSHGRYTVKWSDNKYKTAGRL